MRELALLVALPLLTPPVVADDDQLRQRLEDEHAKGAEHWVYNDITEGIEIARRENKPLFITFRCVPCKACMGFDAEVAGGSDVISKLAREQFVSVRQVEMKGVDLSWFQFDYDLNWAAMFINADGTVYARYGTQSADGPDAFNSIAGLEKTMQRVLKLHAGYPANRSELAGKRGKPVTSSALDLPGLNNREKLAGTTSRRNCIHCHMIHDAQNMHAQSEGQMSQDMLWRYPLPANIGLTIDAIDGLKITAIANAGPASGSGLSVGEQITHMNGQALTSIADMQWVLHGLPNTAGSVTVRGSRSGEHRLGLQPGWKKSDISWRGSLWSVSPRMNVWAPLLPDGKRRQLQLGESETALEVRWINRAQPGGKAAFDAGLRQGDVIVALNGKPVADSPARFQMHIKLNYKVGDRLPLTVLRKGERLDLKVPLVD